MNKQKSQMQMEFASYVRAFIFNVSYKEMFFLQFK